MKNFEQSVQQEIPPQIQDYWELINKMSQDNGNPHEHFEALKTMTENLSETNPDFAIILKKYEGQAAEGMMDALEEYSQVLTEPDKYLQEKE